MAPFANLSFHAMVILSLISAYFTWQHFSNSPILEFRSEISQHYVCEGTERPTKKVAIIGAGSGGASTAYYLERFRAPCQPLNITVYERSNYVGGRSTTVNAYDNPSEPVELGASIFVEVNQNLVSAANELNLTLKSSKGTSRNRPFPAKLGIWDGQKFVFVQDGNDHSWWNTAKLLWQYGVTPIRTQNLMKTTISRFLKMYQEPYFPFRSLSKVALELGLAPLTSITGDELLRQHSILPPFSTDIVQASTRVNYAQSLTQIHGLETMVCMATDGAMSIEGGNWRIFDGMIARSGANLALKTTVQEILHQRDGLLEVRSSKSDGPAALDSEFAELFDTVVIASPLSSSNLTFSPELEHKPDDVQYVRLHVTLFTSPHQISSRMFGSITTIPDVILTTLSLDNAGNVLDPGFYSISTLRTILNPPSGTTGSQYLYKIFSPKQLNATFISQLLGLNNTGERLTEISKKDLTWTYEKVWNSYPYLHPRAIFDDLQLAPNVWYINGIESFISTMETSSLMAKNVASLITDEWNSIIEKGDSQEL